MTIHVHVSGLCHVVSTHEYSIIWVNINPICLLNRSRFLNPSMTHLLNESVVSNCLLDFIKMKKKKNSINQIDMNYEKPKQINIFNIKFITNE